jgi:hypothetical protein
MAANVGAFECLSLFLKKGIHINVTDDSGVTPLHLAARNGHKKCVHRLIECGADIHIQDKDGLTAVHWLACSGRTELLSDLLDKGEFVDVVDSKGQTALHVACQNGHKPTVAVLLERQADVDKADNHGRTPLFFASRYGQSDCAMFLIKRGAKLIPDFEGVSPIDLCVEGCYRECTRVLVDAFPQLLAVLINMVQANKIGEQNLQLALEHVCLSSEKYVMQVLPALAQMTAGLGHELLSLSSDFHHLMPSFLRSVRTLCHLHRISYSGYPARFQSTSKAHVKRHRRTGSYDLDSDSPSSSRHSSIGTDKTPEASACALAAMESLWESLEQWFILLEEEVSKVETKESQQTTNVELESTSTTVGDDAQGIPAKSMVSRSQSQLASLLVQTTPIQVRQAFLRSASVEDQLLQSSSDDYPHRQSRWSGNWECGSVRNGTQSAELHRQTIPEANLGGSFPDISGEGRTSTLVHNLMTSHWLDEEESDQQTSTVDEGTRDAQLSKQDVNRDDKALNSSGEDMVALFADRLCAITHGFYLHCSLKTVLLQRETRFLEFLNRHEKVLKVLLARNPKIIFQHFHFVLELPEVLPRFIHIVRVQLFEERREWFYENLHHDHMPEGREDDQPAYHEEDVIFVSRDGLFGSSCGVLSEADVSRLKKKNIVIRFQGEEGMGAGVQREFYDLLSKEILNPDYALFTPSPDGATVQPNSNSYINPDHLSYFRFAGRIVGMALFHQQLLRVYFTRSFYKHILGVPVNYQDVASIDPEYASNLQWVLDNNITGLGLDLTFAVETDVFGTMQEVELKAGGSRIPVTEENKEEYVQLVAEMRMTRAIRPQIESFLSGFHEFIPPSLISLFDEYELEMLLSGLPEITVSDWKDNTEYSGGYDQETPVVQWFWEVVGLFDHKTRVQLLQFVTGSSRVPFGGFASLVGASGPQKFTISRSDSTASNHLPTASTCFNLLKLPEYNSKEKLRDCLLIALNCGGLGFEFT